MAISPPSDILLDVANAADPAKVRMATARLAKLAAEPPTADSDGAFSKALAAAVHDAKTGAKAPQGDVANGAVASAASLHATIGAQGTVRPSVKSASEAYSKFEAVLLQNVVETMLPKDDELYGDKTSAGVYRSMMAEQFAAQLAKSGGIGIAKAIAAKHPEMRHQDLQSAAVQATTFAALSAARVAKA